MSNLLDRVLKNKDNPTADALIFPTDDKPHTLSDGSVIYDSTIAAINRILSVNLHLHKRSTGVAAKPYRLYDGHIPIDLTDRRTFLTLLKADWLPKTPYQTILVERYVLKYAPTFSKECIVISDGLIWDRNEGKLRTFKEGGNIRTVS